TPKKTTPSISQAPDSLKPIAKRGLRIFGGGCLLDRRKERFPVLLIQLNGGCARDTPQGPPDQRSGSQGWIRQVCDGAVSQPGTASLLHLPSFEEVSCCAVALETAR